MKLLHDTKWGGEDDSTHDDFNFQQKLSGIILYYSALALFATLCEKRFLKTTHKRLESCSVSLSFCFSYAWDVILRPFHLHISIFAVYHAYFDLSDVDCNKMKYEFYPSRFRVHFKYFLLVTLVITF